MSEKIEIKVSGPLGPSERGKGFGGGAWNNMHMGVDGPVTCEICRTNHEERKDQSYIISVFLGHRVVEECCGAIFDIAYRESGEEFTEARLEEFADDPVSSRFFFFPRYLADALSRAEKRISETGEHISQALKSLTVLKKE